MYLFKYPLNVIIVVSSNTYPGSLFHVCTTFSFSILTLNICPLAVHSLLWRKQCGPHDSIYLYKFTLQTSKLQDEIIPFVQPLLITQTLPT